MKFPRAHTPPFETGGPREILNAVTPKFISPLREGRAKKILNEVPPSSSSPLREGRAKKILNEVPPSSYSPLRDGRAQRNSECSHAEVHLPPPRREGKENFE